MTGMGVQMNLLDLLEEVIEGHILPFLSWNDLLRFRRVCRTAHGITTKYMRTHPKLAPELEINEEDKNVKMFLEMDIPTTKLFLDTEASGYAFFDKFAEKLDTLLKKYGHLIKSLRVKEFSFYVSGKEREFLGRLENLESFQADYFGAGTGKADISSEDFNKALMERLQIAQESPEWTIVPESMRLLKYLKVGQKSNLPVANVLLYTLEVFGISHRLEYILLPFNTRLSPLPEIGLPEEALALASVFFMDGIQQDRESHLKLIDFSSYHDALENNPGLSQLIAINGSCNILALAARCLQSGVKLANVDAAWFVHRLVSDSILRNPVRPEWKSPELGHVIVSLININRAVIELDTSNLEKIEIRRTSNIKLDEDIYYGPVQPHWPALKFLEIHVDSNIILLPAEPQRVFDLNQDRMVERILVQRTRDLLNIFFRKVRRLELVELQLTFQENTDVAVPKTEDIVNACPNLKKLTIVNWPGTNKALLTIWNGLPGLEEVVLENCKQLGNVAFVGEERERPVFFRLQNLKKLSLRELDKMPKITDTLFTLVVCQLKLTHCTLTSSAAVKSVTLAGLESLLNGPFAEHVEKMSFDGLSLASASPLELKKLEKKFRSANMQ